MSLRRSRVARRTLCGAALLCLTGAALAQGTSPSTTVTPYVESHLPGVQITSILTVDDGSVPRTGGGTTRMVGIPDGIGVIDGAELSPAEPDFFYLLVNHEINATQGIVRDHGNAGSFVSKWKIDKATLAVVEGDDLIKQYLDWDEGSASFVAGSGLFDRLCSADRPAGTALYDSVSGLGSQEIIYLNGEESFGGRALGHVVTGPDAGTTYHLEHLGFAAFENVLASPAEQAATVVVGLEDADDGEVYVYVGQKQSAGTEVEKAGLVGGNLYALAVEGKPYEYDDQVALAVGEVETFTLKLIGEPGNRPVDGADVEARGADTVTPVDPAQTFESLKMGGPEDGAWDTRPGFGNTFYFVTKGTTSNGITAATRIWKLEFDDISNPAQGGTLTRLKDGPETRLGSLDNVTFDVIGGQPKVYVQEDLGSDSRLSKIWEYDVASGQLEELAQFDAQRFFDGGSSFITTNEESSGIVSLRDVLGEGWFAASVQVHSSTGLSDSTELVEHGQLFLMNIAGRGTDVLRQRVVASGDLWDYRVDGGDPGAGWNDTGYAIDAAWNMDTGGTPTGPVPTTIGYGEAPGVLVTDLGQPASPRPAVTYFRHEFDLADPSAVTLFDLYMKVDDGAVVYVNGVEVARYNMDLDLTVDNGTFASDNEASERDWKQIPITCEDVALQPTGNVIAVSLHQENDSSSDIRLDLELIAWNASPDGGSAPAVPGGLTVGNATEASLDLTWDPQADARFFRIERQAAGDVAWEVVEREYPGEFTAYVDSNVEQGTTYNYRLSAVNTHGRSACSAPESGTTLVSLIPVILEEDFEVPNSLGVFTAIDVAEPNASWNWVLWDFGSTGAAQGNNFGGGNGPTEDWLITTNPINFDFYRNETLKYDAQVSFSGPAPEVLWSNDYDPDVNTDPNTATWNVIQIVPNVGGTFVTQGPFDLSGITGQGYIAFRYTGNGGAGGQSVRFTIDNVLIQGDCGFDFEGAENSNIEDDPNTPWTVVNRNSAFGWIYDFRGGRQGAVNNNFGSPAGGIIGGIESDDWLISPPFSTDGPATIDFDYYENFGDTLDQPLRVLVTDDYTGDPTTTLWYDVTPPGLDGSTVDAYIPVSSQVLPISGDGLQVAFHYRSAGNGGGTTKRIGVDSVCVQPIEGALEADFAFSRNGGVVSFVSTVSGGLPPYEYDWNFGDGSFSDEASPTHEYTFEGIFTVELIVTDAAGTEAVVTKQDAIVVTTFDVPERMGDARIATFNASMNRPTSGGLAEALVSGTDPQIALVAETIQRVDPDVVLLNEFDQIYDGDGNFDRAATEASIADFLDNYLGVAQAMDTMPVAYPYVFVAPSNTGVPSGFDLNNDGDTTDPEDAFGFGEFAGQYGMVLLSKYEIKTRQIRTFQNFLWKDMPGALLPPDPDDTDGDGSTDSYYSEEELAVFRLSSKSHWDVPVRIPDVGVVHLLVSHPTPPVFDDGTAGVDPDVADWNGLRNHDEIRFWADYVSGGRDGFYIYDDEEWADAGGRTPRRPMGGLRGDRRFVILGDENADPVDGDATFDPIDLLLSNARIDTSLTPTSAGALEQVPASFTDRETKTASFNLRADYALPSEAGWNYLQGWVFWPLTTDLEADLLGASDHRMVVVDLEGVDEDDERLAPARSTFRAPVRPGQGVFDLGER